MKNIFGESSVIFKEIWKNVPKWARIAGLFSILGSALIVLLTILALSKYIFS